MIRRLMTLLQIVISVASVVQSAGVMMMGALDDLLLTSNMLILMQAGAWRTANAKYKRTRPAVRVGQSNL